MKSSYHQISLLSINNNSMLEIILRIFREVYGFGGAILARGEMLSRDACAFLHRYR
jgi:hypothetical protein